MAKQKLSTNDSQESLEHLHIVITPEQKENLRIVSFSEKKSVSEIIRLLIDKHLERLFPIKK